MEKEDCDELETEKSTSDAAHYIGSLSGELAELARRHGLESLGYLLDMARLEASHIVQASVDLWHADGRQGVRAPRRSRKGRLG